MSTDPYALLANALDQLPNGFPRTASGVELAILRRIFAPQEADLARHLTHAWEPVEVLAARLGLPIAELRGQLMKMTRRGLVWLDRQDGEWRFRLAPFVVGIYEAQREILDHELAHLVEDYMAHGGAATMMGIEPALHRVIPAHGAVKSEWILPYDDVRALLLAAKSFHVAECICRVQQDFVGRRCTFPLKNCLSFSSTEHGRGPDDLSQQEALALLDEVEELGLVHTVSNVMQGMGYICNCCGCCCGILRGITDWGLDHSVAQANYLAVIDPEVCSGCGVCVQRCQVHAIREEGGVSVVDRAHCIGCGLCVTGCPHEVARLERKPEAETVHPPADFAAWERARLTNRGRAQ